MGSNSSRHTDRPMYKHRYRYRECGTFSCAVILVISTYAVAQQNARATYGIFIFYNFYFTIYLFYLFYNLFYKTIELHAHEMLPASFFFARFSRGHSVRDDIVSRKDSSAATCRSTCSRIRLRPITSCAASPSPSLLVRFVGKIVMYSIFRYFLFVFPSTAYLQW